MAKQTTLGEQPCPGGCGYVANKDWLLPGRPHCCGLCFSGMGHGPLCSHTRHNAESTGWRQ